MRKMAVCKFGLVKDLMSYYILEIKRGGLTFGLP